MKNSNKITQKALLFGFALALGYISGTSRLDKQHAVNFSKPRFEKIISIPGTRCQKGLYELRSDDPRCYDLQEKLHNCSIRNDLNGMADALKHGANIEGIVYDSFPPLIAAATDGQSDAVEFLLDNGANPNRVLTFGITPLKSAVRVKNEPIVKLLLQRGANVCDNTSDTGSAIAIARDENQENLVKILKNAGADKCN